MNIDSDSTPERNPSLPLMQSGRVRAGTWRLDRRAEQPPLVP
jgi:hypothetical protein